jgi:hypothetical protein
MGRRLLVAILLQAGRDLRSYDPERRAAAIA